MKYYVCCLIAIIFSSCQQENKQNRLNIDLKESTHVNVYRKVIENNSDFDSIFVKTNEVILNADAQHVISSIRNMCVTNDNYVINDVQGKQILVFDKKGKFSSSIGNIGSGPGEFKSPYDIALNSKGELLVLDPSNRRISVFQRDGSFLNSYNVKLGSRISKDHKGGFYLYNAGEAPFSGIDILYHYNDDGSFKKAFCPVFSAYPMIGGNITIDTQGNLFVIHPSVYLIKKFSPNGHFIKDIGQAPKIYKPIEIPKGQFPQNEDFESYTPLTKVLVLNNLVIVELYRAKPQKRWLDIYDTEGNLIKNGIEVDFNLFLSAVGSNNTIFFIKNPSNDEKIISSEVPDFQIVSYKIRSK